MVLMLAAPASAEPKVRGGDSGNVTFEDSRPGDETRRPPATGERWFVYEVLVWDPGAGAYCLDRWYTRDEAFANQKGPRESEVRFDEATGASRPSCPEAPAPAPATVAAEVWRHVEDLPVPALDIQPDFAITGKAVYLEITGARAWTRTIDNPVGDDVVITATSDYSIDWGDPTYDYPDVTTSQGGPYPDGDVTHVYTDRTPRTEIRVTQRWKATWRAGSATGTLDQLTTQANPLPLEVREIQAVRDR